MLADVLHADNRRILQMIAEVEAGVTAADALPEGTLCASLADRLSADAHRLVSLFTHYKQKERLLFPFLETRGASQACAEATERDDMVRTYVSMALMLMPGAQARPSAGNLQSVAAQLADACEASATVLAEEEAELLPLARKLLGEADWAQVDAGIPQVAPAKADDPSTWQVSPLEMAVARMSARGL